MSKQLSSVTGRILALELFLISWGIGSPAICRAAWAPNGTPVCTAANTQSMSVITSDLLNGAVIAWWDERSGSPRIYVQRMSATGSQMWTPGGVAMHSTTGSQSTPGILTDFANGAVVFWTDHRNPTFDVYARRIDSAGAPQWGLDGNALVATTGNDEFAAVITDGSGGVTQPIAYLVASYENAAGDVIRLQRVDVTGAGLWTSASTGGVVVAANGNSMYYVALATDGVGTVLNPKGAVLTWTDYRSGDGGDIYARRVNAGGVVQWAANGIGVCTAPAGQSNSVIANVGSDKVIIAWADSRNSATTGADIYAQKLDSAGNALWAGNGLPVCQHATSQVEPKILRDGAGGAFIVWVDFRNGSGGRIYGQRIDANGQPLWTPNGIPLCTAGKVEQIDSDYYIISDGAGGAIVSWADLRVPLGDLYGQHVDANGNLLWDAAGLPFFMDTSRQWDPVLVTDGVGGVISSWMDNRNGAFDIYATRIAGDGGTTSAPVVSAALPKFSLASSNPTRGAARFNLEIPNESFVAMDVFDIAGRRVRSIANGLRLTPGIHPLTWDGAGESGTPVPAGSYFVRLSTLEEDSVMRLVVIR
jgi:hypothetical protein